MDPIHDLIVSYVNDLGLTEADIDCQNPGYVWMSRRDIARLIFHIRRLELHVDAGMAEVQP